MAITVTPKYKPFTYDELVKPLEGYWEKYDEQENSLQESINSLEQLKSIVDAAPDTNSEKQNFYNLYNDFDRSIDALIENGLTKGNKKSFLDLKRQYNAQIPRILAAEELARKAKQDFLTLQNSGKYIVVNDNNPGSFTWADYLDGNIPIYDNAMDKNEIRSHAKALAAQVSSRLINNPVISTDIIPGYDSLIEERGVKAKTIDEMMRNSTMNQLYQNIRQKYDTTNWDDSAIQSLENEIKSGLFEGLTYDKQFKHFSNTPSSKSKTSSSKSSNSPANKFINDIKKLDNPSKSSPLTPLEKASQRAFQVKEIPGYSNAKIMQRGNKVYIEDTNTGKKYQQGDVGEINDQTKEALEKSNLFHSRYILGDAYYKSNVDKADLDGSDLPDWARSPTEILKLAMIHHEAEYGKREFLSNDWQTRIYKPVHPNDYYNLVAKRSGYPDEFKKYVSKDDLIYFTIGGQNDDDGDYHVVALTTAAIDRTVADIVNKYITGDNIDVPATQISVLHDIMLMVGKNLGTDSPQYKQLEKRTIDRLSNLERANASIAKMEHLMKEIDLLKTHGDTAGLLEFTQATLAGSKLDLHNYYSHILGSTMAAFRVPVLDKLSDKLDPQYKERFMELMSQNEEYTPKMVSGGQEDTREQEPVIGSSPNDPTPLQMIFTPYVNSLEKKDKEKYSQSKQ